MRKRALIFILAGLCILVLGFYLWVTPQTSAMTGRELLDTLPAAEAYNIFKAQHKNAPLQEAHTQAHLFGEALYEKLGVEGFAICDSNFGFGCYHSFIARAIAYNGESTITYFDSECIRIFGTEGLGCSHGIGHGILSFYGYTFDDLEHSLELCSSLTWKGAYGGCKDGVFMEYNLRVMETEPADRYRKYSDATRYEPCGLLARKFQSACYFSQPEWWVSMLRTDEAYLRAGGYCGEVRDRQNREACFRGLGYSLGSFVQFEVAQGIEKCDSSSKGRKEIIQCREGLAWSLYANPVHREQSNLACTQGLAPKEQLLCLDEYLFVLQ